MNTDSKELRTVVTGNDLVDASYKLGINELRLLNLALSKIDSRKPNPGELTLYPAEFAKVYGIENNDLYRTMRNAVKGIGRNPVMLPVPGKNRTTELYWLVKSEYDNGEDGTSIKLQFSPLVEPYLFELKEKFTAISFEHCSRLTTPFSYRLYQWLIRYRNFDNQKQRETVVVQLDIDWMKEKAGISGEYGRWERFKHRVIDPAIEQINSKTDISVIWRPIRNGRKTTTIEFSFVTEQAVFAKPERPRLARRPKALPGTAKEGEWAKTNLDRLLAYRKALQEYDTKARLDIKDLQRLVEYMAILGDSRLSKAKAELEKRRKS